MGSWLDAAPRPARREGLLDGANANHRIRFVPDTDYNGTSSITYRAWDQTTGTVTQTANTTNTGTTTAFSTGLVTKTITVTAVNDQPDVSLSSNPTVNEDAGAQTITNFATPSNGATQLEGSQTFTYSISNNSNSLFSAQPAIADNGTLTYTPAANANGTATVTLTVQDSGGTSNSAIDLSLIHI